MLLRFIALVGRAESSITLFFATVAIAALKKFDVGPAMPAFFRLALTTVAVKSLSPNFPHGPLEDFMAVFFCWRGNSLWV